MCLRLGNLVGLLGGRTALGVSPSSFDVVVAAVDESRLVCICLSVIGWERERLGALILGVREESG